MAGRGQPLSLYEGVIHPARAKRSVAELARRFAAADKEILFLNVSPQTKCRVVKAIVPGLEVGIMRYHCIGEHGSKLAGLHGPAWLDTAEIDRIIGRLYPLYREPKVHSAPTALERRP